MVLLPIVFGSNGIRATAQMGMVGIANLMIFRLAKNGTRRPRPCNAYDEICRGAAPLDEYSFPSGHTLHAVGFSIVACSWFPELTILLSVLTGLIALSRVILGLHYPTDVALGAVIGFAVARLSCFIL
jgi:undecaprenyl-diphosphatase